MVASIFLCKIIEWVKGPVIIHSFKDGIEDSLTTAFGSKGTHGSDASTDFYEETLNDIGGTNTSPVFFRTLKECQELFDIFGQAGDGFGSTCLPTFLPLIQDV